MPFKLPDELSGITQGLNGSANEWSQDGTPSAVQSGGGFIGAVANTIGHAAVGAGKYMVDSVVKPLQGISKAAGEYAPVIGSVAQHYKEKDQQRKALDNQVKQLHNRYYSTDPTQKISKDDFQKGLKNISDQYAAMTKESQDFTNSLTTTKQAAKDIGETALMVLTAGGAKAVQAGGEALYGASKLAPGIGKAADFANHLLETGYKALPGVKLAESAGGISAKGAMNVAGRVGLKYPLATLPAAQAAVSTPGDIQKGDWNKVALNAGAFVAAPAIFKGVSAAAPTIRDAASKLLFNKPGAVISRLNFKDGTVPQFLENLKQTDPKAYAKYNDIAKVAEDHYQGDGTKAYHLEAYHQKEGLPIGKMTAQEYLDNQKVMIDSHNWINANPHRIADARPAPVSPVTGKPMPAPGKPGVPTDASWDQGPAPRGSNPLDAMSNGNATPKLSKAKQAAVDEANAKSEADFNNAFKKDGKPGTMEGSNLKGNLTVGRMDNKQAAAITHAMTSGTKEQAQAYLDELIANKADVTKNPTLLAHLTKVAGIDDPALRKAALGDINRTVKLAIKGSGRTGMGNGYFPIYTEKPVYGFKAAKDVAELGADHQAPLAPLGNIIRKLGISPEGSDPGEFGAHMSAGFSNHLEGTRFAGQSGQLLSKMFEYMDTTQGIFDPRLIKLSAMKTFLGVSGEDAQLIRSALDRAYTDVPLGARALGEKLTDNLVRRLPGMREYLKAQSYGRFAANPIFWIKRDVKTDFVAGAEVGGKAPNLGAMLNKLTGLVKDPGGRIEAAIHDRGYFSKGMSQVGDVNDLMGDYRSSVSMDTGSVANSMSKRAASAYQQQSLIQLTSKFMKIHGIDDIDKLMADNGALGTEYDHLMRLSVGYGAKKGEAGGYLTSNFAKTLNVLVFPSRFDTKVAMAFGKYYGQQAPIVQGAIANGILQAREYLGSPEGAVWRKDNADAIALVGYFTPIETLSKVLDSVLVPGQHPLPDFGAIGGLPLGVISTILQHQGVAPDWLKGTPGFNPKTGEPYAENLPVTDKARIQTMLTDFVGSMYSYPGKTLGLPLSKTQMTQIIPGLKPDAGSMQSSVGGSAGASNIENPILKGWQPDTSHTMAQPSFPTQSAPAIKSIGTGKATKAPKTPAWLNGYKTTTARPMPK